MAHIRLNTHPSQGGQAAPPVVWGARDPAIRGPVVGTVGDPARRNAIGVHSGSYGIYRALAIAAHELKADHRPDFTNTSPAERIGPFESWFDPRRSCRSIRGAILPRCRRQDGGRLGHPPDHRRHQGARNMPIADAIAGRLKPDNNILTPGGDVKVTKAAVEPVWWLPGIAALRRQGSRPRRTLFEQTGGMYTELVTRPDLELFAADRRRHDLFLGDVRSSASPRPRSLPPPRRVQRLRRVRLRHLHGGPTCARHRDRIEMARRGGVGVIYSRKEGRALGEVTKFLVYNARSAANGIRAVLQRTECVAGPGHALPELMPDLFHWLGIARIDRFASMSNMKSDALRERRRGGRAGADPDELIPADAQVEMDARRPPAISARPSPGRPIS
jgi:hypothetical protein